MAPAAVPLESAAEPLTSLAAQPLVTPSGNQEDVKGVSTYTPQPPLEKDLQHSKSEMETDFYEGDKQDIVSDSNLSAWQGSQEDTVTRASAIVNEWTSQILEGREAVLKLPRADPAIPLVKEIAKQANFTLTEKPSGDETIIDFVYAGVKGAWEDQAPFASCNEPSRTWGSALQVTDTDSDSVVVMGESVFIDLGGHYLSDYPKSRHHGQWIHEPRASSAVNCWPEARLGIGLGPRQPRYQGPGTC